MPGRWAISWENRLKKTQSQTVTSFCQVGGPSLRIEVVKGRNMPFKDDSSGEVFFSVFLADREIQTKSAALGGSVEWGQTFEMRMPKEADQKEMVTFLMMRAKRCVTLVCSEKICSWFVDSCWEQWHASKIDLLKKTV